MSDLLIERTGARGTIVFNNPARRNALKFSMWRDLPGSLAELNEDPAVRVIILRGAGQEAFVAGADISEFEEQRRDASAAEAYNAATAAALAAIRSSAKPTIAMIHGFCFGGGCAIALACDLRLAAASARFSIPAARLGIGYGTENVRHIVHTLGAALAREMLLTARVYNADEALRLGIVHRVVTAAAGEPPISLEDFTADYAERMAELAPLSLSAIKLAVNATAGDDAARAAAEAAMRACFDSADYQEGYRAFLEKRPARFTGR